MLVDPVRFDDHTRPSLSDQPVPPGGFLRALRHVAEASGLDPVAELYNEALRYAHEGHLRMARERLHVLLGVNPDDGEARLLLARVYAAGQRWNEALTALDEAQSCGHTVDPSLRAAIEENLAADNAAQEAHREALRAREHGEVKALRSEARRLRAENAQLLGRVYDTEREMRKWAWTTAAVSALTIAFIAINLVIGTPGDSAEVPAAPVVAEVAAPEDDAVAADAADAAPERDAPAAAGVTNAEVAEAARAALTDAPELDGTALELRVRAGSAIMTGEVQTFTQRAEAERVLTAVPGVKSVDTAGVNILARTKGTHHVVASGDSLSKIARVYYGDASLSKHILRANSASLHGKTDLKIGQKLIVPPIGG
jgi:nucleoid-associated protein YgaU